MQSGLYAYLVTRALTDAADSVNLPTNTSQNIIRCAILTVAPTESCFNTLDAAHATYGGASTGYTELATGHGYTQNAAPSTAGFPASLAFGNSGSSGSYKLLWPNVTATYVYTATDSTGIVQPANGGLLLYWSTTPFPLIVFDLIASGNSATGNGATYTATWSGGVFSIQVE